MKKTLTTTRIPLASWHIVTFTVNACPELRSGTCPLLRDLSHHCGQLTRTHLHGDTSLHMGYDFLLPYLTQYFSWHPLRYALRLGMIRSIRHKGFKRFHEDDDARGLTAEHVIKLRDILARLDGAR